MKPPIVSEVLDQQQAEGILGKGHTLAANRMTLPAVAGHAVYSHATVLSISENGSKRTTGIDRTIRPHGDRKSQQELKLRRVWGETCSEFRS